MFNSKVRQPLFDLDGDIGGGQAADGIAPATSGTDFAPGWGLPKDGNKAAEGSNNPMFNPAPVPPAQEAPQVLDFAGRKIEVVDPTIAAALKDVHKDYMALTGTYTQTNQRVKELEQANQTYLNLLQNVQQPSAQPNAAPVPSQPTPEDVEQMKADFMDQFYENPQTAIEGLLDNMFQQRVQPIIEPISQEQQWNKQMQDLSNKYPDDFHKMVGPMRELLEEMPELAQHGLESVFQIARRATPPPQPGPEQLLNDPQFIEQMMQKPEIQKQFLSQYVQEKQGSQQQAPTVMGGQPGGFVPFTPENQPKDIRSATQAYKRSLGIYN